MLRSLSVSFCFALLLHTICPVLRAQDAGLVSIADAEGSWPWWRGPQRNGWAAEGSSPPVKFGNQENVIWKAKVPGRGHSSPIVVGSNIFIATADEQKQLHAVCCYDLATGDSRWSEVVSRGGFPTQNHPKNTEASPTLASDGKLLFATFFHHKQVELIALKFDGSVAWRKQVCQFNPQKYEYGYAPSPVLYEDKVIVAAEYDGSGSSLVAFKRSTGKEVWRTRRPPNITFSSPVIAKIAGRDQMFFSGSGLVSSYDPRNGKLLWQVEGTTAATCGTMVWENDLVFASGGYPKKETIAVQADGSRRVLWRNDKKCYEQSMIVVEGFLYGLTDRGIIYCWRAEDGKEMWRGRLQGPVSSSPVLAGGHIYWANEKGTVYVFKPNPAKLQLVSENRLGDEIFASPAVVGNRMLWRTSEREGGQRQGYLYLIGED